MAAEPGIHVSLSDSETLKDAKSLIGVLRLPVIGKIGYWEPSYQAGASDEQLGSNSQVLVNALTRHLRGNVNRCKDLKVCATNFHRACYCVMG